MFDTEMKDSIWNHNPAKFQKECKRLRALCLRIIKGEETVIEGSLKMGAFWSWMKEQDNKDWDIFRVVYSKTVHLPIGSVRQYWASESLEVKDKEIKKVEDFYRAAVVEAARRIRTEYEKHIEPVSAAKADKRPRR
jgi:hypothetical protein